MNGTMKLWVPLVAALGLAACNAGGSSNMPATAGQSPAQVHRWGANVQQACPDATPGRVMCLALERTDIRPSMHPAVVDGLTPADFQQAYDLPSSTKGTGQIVAIVDAYDNPNIASDLAAYRSEFGLPAAKFTKYNEDGQTSNYPTGNVGWGVEEDLDVDMVSASCPNCTIDLIEANSNYDSDLDTAEAEAVTLGAHIVTNSWGGSCSGSCYGYGSYFDSPGVTYLGSAGDGGYGTIFPSQLASVVSVGGTTLTTDTGVKRGWNETVWNGTGGGCSTSPKPSWQHDPGCTGRTANDVSADANPSSGAAEYDTYGRGGWIIVGGTSLSSPLTAGIFGLAGNANKVDAGKKFWTMTKKERGKHLNAVTSGSDGTCSPTYLCTAGTKEYKDYSGPAGWGTPKGIGAF